MRDDTWMAKLGAQDQIKEEVLDAARLERSVEALTKIKLFGASMTKAQARGYVMACEEIRLKLAQTHKERVEPKP